MTSLAIYNGRFAGRRYYPRRQAAHHVQLRREVVLVYTAFLATFVSALLIIGLTEPASIPPLLHVIPRGS